MTVSWYDEYNDKYSFIIHSLLSLCICSCLFMNTAFIQNLLFVITEDREYEPKLFAMIDISYIFIIITSIVALVSLIYFIKFSKQQESEASSNDDISQIKIAHQ